jgi:PAS domain S-box-containing protein
MQMTDGIFRMVWESAADAMALSDPNGIVTAANPAYYTLYGLRPQEVIGCAFSVIFPPEQRAQADEDYRRYFYDMPAQEGVRASVQRPDGSVALVDVRYAFLEEGGKRSAMLSVIRDITDQSRVEESERLLTRRNEQVMLALSHDLKNPLTAIQGYADVLLRRLTRSDDLPPSATRDGLGKIQEAARRMAQMIDGLLASTAAHTPADGLAPSEVDLVALVRSVATVQQEVAQDQEIVVEANCPVIGWWDENRIRRVAENLLSNAVKYSPAGEQIVVSLRTDETAGRVWAVLEVTDHGIGIPDADLPHIFKPFYRASNVGDTTAGTGLGLSSTRHIVQLHGGSIAVHSPAGGGCTVIVRLPTTLRQG